MQARLTKRSKKSTRVRARTAAKARAGARLGTTGAKARTPARAKAAAPPTAASRPRLSFCLREGTGAGARLPALVAFSDGFGVDGGQARSSLWDGRGVI